MSNDRNSEENSSTNIMISRKLILEKNNDRSNLVISIYNPEQILPNLFKTLVVFSDGITESHRISGYDEMQSIGLAITFVDRRISDFSDEYTIEWENGSLF